MALAAFSAVLAQTGAARAQSAAALAVPNAAAPRDPAAATPAQTADQLEKSADTVVADVNGAPITLGMVADRLRAMPQAMGALPTGVLYQGALDALIEQRALAVKARELGLDKDPVTIRRITVATDQELGRALLRRIEPEMVTEEAVAKFYAATVAGKPGPEEVQFRVIATATEDEAVALSRRIAEGSGFADIARQYSVDPSAAAGGEIGYARRDRLSPEIGAVAFALAPGQVTAFPVLSNGRWFIIQAEGRRQQSTPSLEESRSRLVAELNRAAGQEIFMKTRASVVVKDYGATGKQGSGDAASGKKP